MAVVYPRPGMHLANPRGIDKDPIALALFHHLGIPGHDRHASLFGGDLIAYRDDLESSYQQASIVLVQKMVIWVPCDAPGKIKCGKFTNFHTK